MTTMFKSEGSRAEGSRAKGSSGIEGSKGGDSGIEIGGISRSDMRRLSENNGFCLNCRRLSNLELGSLGAQNYC